jgi:malignant T-cell-amplified sequence
MFRKFDPENDVSTSTQIKASVQRAIKSQILEAHPGITEEQLEELLPKKSPLVQYKVGPHVMLYCQHMAEGESSGFDFPTVFQHRDGPILPVLKWIHQYPSLKMTTVTVDKGAIPFLLGGANIMCPGLLHPNSYMPDDTDDGTGVAKGEGVVIMAEGKQFALAVGVMLMSSAEM